MYYCVTEWIDTGKDVMIFVNLLGSYTFFWCFLTLFCQSHHGIVNIVTFCFFGCFCFRKRRDSIFSRINRLKSIINGRLISKRTLNSVKR